MVLQLTGRALTVGDLAGLPSSGPIEIELGPGVREAVVAASAAAREATGGPVYGRSTGVGANRTVAVDDGDHQHGLRLIRSHAYDAGDPLPATLVRAAMVVRANQLAQARSGLRPEVLDALLAACADGRSPTVGRASSMGVGDVALFAAVGLALLGERPWSDGTVHAYLDHIGAEDALAVVSTNAALIAQAAVVAHRTERLLHTVHVVAALSHVAMRGNVEAFDPRVHAARPHPGTVRSAAISRLLLAGAGEPARMQDPLSLRCSPQIHGAALSALDDVQRDLAVEMASTSENPLYDDGRPLHHGGFHNALLGLATDHLRLAVLQVADASLARLTLLHEPGLTGQRAFLAHGPSTASGTMMAEYTAVAALGDARSAAHPASGASARYSRGVEDHASFAWQSALEADRLLDAVTMVVACELLAAVRSLRVDGPQRVMPPVLAEAAGPALALAVVLDDHDLGPHLAAARAVVTAGLTPPG